MYEIASRPRAARKSTPTPSGADAGAPAGAVKPRQVIQSVDRALDIIEALARSSGKMSLAELSARAGLNLSTCHHLVATVARRGYITQDRATKRYSLSSKIFELADARAGQIDLVDLALPALSQLNRATGEAVNLAVIEGTELVTVAKLASLHAVKVDGALGKSNAAHATATGKAILAWLPETEIDAILVAKGMERFTEQTIATRADLVEALRLVRRYGYSEEREEFQPGVYCVGAAIRGHKGVVAGSVSVSLPTMRVSDETLAKTRREVMAAALAITKELGASPAS